MRAWVLLTTLTLFACGSQRVAGERAGSRPATPEPPSFSALSDCSWAPHALPQPFVRTHLVSGEYTECIGPPVIDGQGDVLLNMASDNVEWSYLLLADGGAPSSSFGTFPTAAGYVSIHVGQGPEPSLMSVSSAEIIPSDGGWVYGAYWQASRMYQDSPDHRLWLTFDWGPTDPNYGIHGVMLRLRRFDDHARVAWTRDLGVEGVIGDPWARTATTVANQALVLMEPPDGGDVTARWFDEAGNDLASTDLGAREDLLESDKFVPSLSGGVIAVKDGRAIATLEPGAPVEPPPAWLQRLDFSSLEVAPFDRGYVLYPPSDGGSPATVSFFDRNGASCGSLEVPASPSGWGFGADGSIAALRVVELPDAGPACEAVVWPGVIR